MIILVAGAWGALGGFTKPDRTVPKQSRPTAVMGRKAS